MKHTIGSFWSKAYSQNCLKCILRIISQTILKIFRWVWWQWVKKENPDQYIRWQNITINLIANYIMLCITFFSFILYDRLLSTQRIPRFGIKWTGYVVCSKPKGYLSQIYTLGILLTSFILKLSNLNSLKRCIQLHANLFIVIRF